MSERFANEIRLIEDSLLFDGEWYLRQYADVASLGMGAAEHYLRFGARMLRDPGPGFSTRFYLEQNADVRAAGINPFVHYLRHGRIENRAALPQVLDAGDFRIGVDIVVPVFNALEDVKRCIASVARHRDGFRVGLIVVNDGSNQDTSEWLRLADADHGFMQLIENQENLGYTRSVNVGLRASTADHVVTLNSDTIVTPGWLHGLVRCMASHPRIAIVGPLSNAASWQNVPALLGEDGQFAVNDTAGLPIDEMAQVVAFASRRRYPRTPFVNGFCFMIHRRLIDAIGYMDEENFPVGYGEENDYCIRAADAGFDLAIADDVYVFHAKSKSFGHERRKELSRAGSEMLRSKHTPAKFAGLLQRVKDTTQLDLVRRDVVSALRSWSHDAEVIVAGASPRILFLLPVKGGSGGAHSVVQEAGEMRRIGLDVRVAVRHDRVQSFIEQYPEIPDATALFVGYNPANVHAVAADYDIVVGTIFASMQTVAEIVTRYPHVLPAYYVQDYEPLFFPEKTGHWKQARESYTLVPGALLFAKTAWIIGKVEAEHGVRVAKVAPSIDHDVYFPAPRHAGGQLRIVAMIRPQTPRRGADRTMRVFQRLADRFGDRVRFDLFGCEPDDPLFQELERGFPFVNHGILKRSGVAQLLQQGDVFVDLSDYQAFGRTALEAMACGCVSMVTAHGGADEYAIDGVNAITVDSFDESVCEARLAGLIERPQDISRMRAAALNTAAGYSVHAAAVSELTLFSEAHAHHRRKLGGGSRRHVVVIPSRREDGTPTASAYVRALLPYRSRELAGQWRVSVGQALPAPGTADAVVLHGDGHGVPVDALEAWWPQWRAAGGRLVFDSGSRFVGAAQASPNATERWLLDNADVVAVADAAMADGLGVDEARVRVVPDRLDHGLWKMAGTRDAASGEFGRRPGVVRIGSLGSPDQALDLHPLAAALRRIQHDFAGRVDIETVGIFQKVPPLFGTRVGLPRRTEYPDLVDWYQQRVHWDIGLVPAPADGAGPTRMSFLEQAALGMALVCADGALPPDLVEDGRDVLLVGNTEEQWYQTIRRLVEDAALRDALESAARRLVSSRHCHDQDAQAHAALLDGQ